MSKRSIILLPLANSYKGRYINVSKEKLRHKVVLPQSAPRDSSSVRRKLTRDEERSISRQRTSSTFASIEEIRKTSIFWDPEGKKNQSIEEARADCTSTNFGQW